MNDEKKAEKAKDFLRMPPHIAQMIIRNPKAVLTERGIVLLIGSGREEILVGLPNASSLYGEHYDEIRKNSGIVPVVEAQPNTDVVEPKPKTETKESTQTPVVEITATPTEENKPAPVASPGEVSPKPESTSSDISVKADEKDALVEAPSAVKADEKDAPSAVKADEKDALVEAPSAVAPAPKIVVDDLPDAKLNADGSARKKPGPKAKD